LIVGVERLSRPEPVDLGSDGRLAALHRMVKGFEDETELRWELLEVHGAETTAVRFLRRGRSDRRPV